MQTRNTRTQNRMLIHFSLVESVFQAIPAFYNPDQKQKRRTPVRLSFVTRGSILHSRGLQRPRRDILASISKLFVAPNSFPLATSTSLRHPRSGVRTTTLSTLWRIDPGERSSEESAERGGWLPGCEPILSKTQQDPGCPGTRQGRRMPFVGYKINGPP